MSIRRYTRVKASTVLTRADHLFINNYIRTLLNIIVRPNLLVSTEIEPMPYYHCMLHIS